MRLLVVFLVLRALGGAAEPLRILDLTTSVTKVDFRNRPELAARKAALGYNQLDIIGRYRPG